MQFEERRPVRSAFAGTAGGFVAAATIARPDAAPAKGETGTRPISTLVTDAVAHPERR